MFGVEFSHQGEGCTFEALSAGSPSRSRRARVAAIVHDLDHKDGSLVRGKRTVGAMIEGLQLAYPDDEALLEQGMSLFDSLNRAFEQSDRSRDHDGRPGRNISRTSARKVRPRKKRAVKGVAKL